MKNSYPKHFSIKVKHSTIEEIIVNPAVMVKNPITRQCLNVYQDTEPERFNELIDTIGEQFVVYDVRYWREKGHHKTEFYSSLLDFTTDLEFLGIDSQTIKKIFKFNRNEE
jgi:hypothetical protein